MRRRRAIVAATLLAGTLVGAGCGSARQDANEPNGSFPVRVTHASFPAKQRMAHGARMVIAVKNRGSKAIPDVAVTVDSFSTRIARKDVADPTRPVWIVNRGPVGGATAYDNTWALGRLAPGKTARFVWHVTALRPGSHSISYRVAAGLDGKAKAKAPGGGAARGSFAVDITGKPTRACVNAAGRLIRAPRRTRDNTCRT